MTIGLQIMSNGSGYSLQTHVVYGQIGVVPLHRIAAPRGHDVKTLQHDGRDHV